MATEKRCEGCKVAKWAGERLTLTRCQDGAIRKLCDYCLEDERAKTEAARKATP